MWEELEAGAVDVRQAEQARDDTDRLFARVFGTEEGQKVMGILKRWHVDPPVATPGADPSFAFYREGQRFVVQDIEARTRRAMHE